MLLVVTLVAVLIALRGVTTVWLVQDAWAWWTHRAAAPVAGPPPIYQPSPARAGPPPPSITLPPGTTAPEGNPGAWFSADVYPPEAIRAGEEGRTVARVLIGADGRVEACGIVASSGSTRLDAATCEAARRRGSLQPARDASGKATRSTLELPVRWVLPRD